MHLACLHVHASRLSPRACISALISVADLVLSIEHGARVHVPHPVLFPRLTANVLLVVVPNSDSREGEGERVREEGGGSLRVSERGCEGEGKVTDQWAEGVSTAYRVQVGGSLGV